MNIYLPIIAIIISVISLSVSIFLAWRDRARLKTSCNAYTHPDTGEYSYIKIMAVNCGRRPITLRYIWGKYLNNNEGGYELPLKKTLLNEGDFFEKSIGKFDGMMMFIDDNSEAYEELIELFFEDTKGKKYKIKNSKEMILKVINSKQPFGPRTHT